MDRIPFERAVRDQPRTLQKAIAAAELGVAALPAISTRPEAILAIYAMGASTNAGESLVHAARREGRIVLNHPASVWTAAARPRADWALAISESGRSPEPIAALESFEGPKVALTNVPGSLVSQLADVTVSMGAFPDSGVYVTGYTATLAALAVVGRYMGLRDSTESLNEVPDAVQGLIESLPEQLHPIGHRVRPTVVDVVAGPESFCSAVELALLLREAARLPAASHLTDQYLHGPVESLEPGHLLVLIGDDTGGLIERFDNDMTILHVTREGRSRARHQVEIPPLPAFAANILEAVVAQFIASTLNDGQFEIGRFRHEFENTKLPS